MRKRSTTERRKLLEAVVAGGLIAFALASCNTASTPPATDREKQVAEEDYVACLKKSALSIDDGRLDAGSLSREILPLCAEQFERYRETYGRGLKPEARQAFDAKLMEYEHETAEAAVLAERAQRRPPAGQPAN